MGGEIVYAQRAATTLVAATAALSKNLGLASVVHYDAALAENLEDK